MITIKDIAETRDQIREMEALQNDQIRKLYPKGADIRWQKGGNNLSGTVVRTSSDRVQVHNPFTEKEYWITLYDILTREGLT